MKPTETADEALKRVQELRRLLARAAYLPVTWEEKSCLMIDYLEEVFIICDTHGQGRSYKDRLVIKLFFTTALTLINTAILTCSSSWGANDPVIVRLVALREWIKSVLTRGPQHALPPPPRFLPPPNN